MSKVATSRAPGQSRAAPIVIYYVRMNTAWDFTEKLGRTDGYGWVQDIAIVVHLGSGASHLYGDGTAGHFLNTIFTWYL